MEKNLEEVEYLVIHSTTESDILFADMNYSVDHYETIIRHLQPVSHCGNSGTYIHPQCRNSNSLGIQLYAHSDDYITPDVENRAAELVANLMIVHDIPIENVLRHYDVTHKKCPAPYVADDNKWENFKELILDYHDQISML